MNRVVFIKCAVVMGVAVMKHVVFIECAVVMAQL